MGRVAKYKKVKSFDRGGANGAAASSDFALFGVGGADVRRRRKLEKRERRMARYDDRDRTKKGRKRPGGGRGGDAPRRRDRPTFDEPPPPGEGNEFDPTTWKVLGGGKDGTDGRKPEDLLMPAPSPSTDDAAKPPPRVGKDGTPIGMVDDEEVRVARMLRVDGTAAGGGGRGGGAGERDKNGIIQGRMEGESMNAFHRRVREETRTIIRRQVDEAGGGVGLRAMRESNPQRYRKKVEFLNRRKGKKRGRRGGAVGSGNDERMERMVARDEDEYDRGDGRAFVTGERAVAAAATAARGGIPDQVERPPSFGVNMLPRGAKKRKASTSCGHLGDGEKDGAKLETEQKQAAERRAMEIMREKVQAQYALVKAKRRKEGRFHL